MEASSGTREKILLALAVFGGLALAALFTFFGAEVVDGDFVALDLRVREWVMARRTDGGEAFFTLITRIGNKAVLIGIALVVGWFLERHLRDRVALLALIGLCAFVAAEFVDFLKEQFAIARPPQGRLERESQSFPSGHASGTAAMATLLGFVSLRERRFQFIVTPIAAVVVLLVAMSRVYLDQHWLSDVVGGIMVGGALGTAMCALYVWFRRRAARSRTREGQLEQPGGVDDVHGAMN